MIDQLYQPFVNLATYLNGCDCLKFSLLPGILIFSAIAGLNFWLKMEVLLSVLFGVALMIEPSAKYFLQLQVIQFHIS